MHRGRTKPLTLKALAVRALLVVWSVVVALTLAHPAQAKRNNITSTGGTFTLFDAEALTTTDVTSTVTVPTAMTEGAAAIINCQGLTGSNSVTLTRLERGKSDETKYGYPVPCYAQKYIVVTANGPMSYPVAWTEGVEYFTYNITTSQASGVQVSVQVVTQ